MVWGSEPVETRNDHVPMALSDKRIARTKLMSLASGTYVPEEEHLVKGTESNEPSTGSI
jgi:hypothetical protein